MTVFTRTIRRGFMKTWLKLRINQPIKKWMN